MDNCSVFVPIDSQNTLFCAPKNLTNVRFYVPLLFLVKGILSQSAAEVVKTDCFSLLGFFMPVKKFDYEPLLAPGRHFTTLQNIFQLCVEPFQGNPRVVREALYLKAESLVQEFLVLLIPCSFFFDGSYFTRKPEPHDIDIVISIDNDVIENLNEKQNILISLINTEDYIQNVDASVYVCYTRDSPLFGDWSDPNLVCAGYGLEHGGQWAKGYAVLRLHETNVGLRICR